MRLRTLLVVLILYLGIHIPLAQSLGFQLTTSDKVIEIPFEFYNNFLIVNVKINHFFPLRFIFDTGAEHTIITKQELTNLLAITYGREYKLYGADMQTELIAFLASNVHLRVENVIAPQQNILILKEDYFRFEEYAGTGIYGILGADLFKRFVVEINYRRRLIRLHRPSTFEIPDPEDYQVLNIKINRNKPYLPAKVHLQNDTIVETNLLLDTGASLGLLLNTFTHPDLGLPENTVAGNIGAGLGGFIEGFTGRVKKLELANHELPNVVTNFQELPLSMDTAYLNGRNGIIGNEIWSRFSVFIDYINSKLYLKPNRKFKKAFKFDRSGLAIIATGSHQNNFVVQYVYQNSPAARAGIHKGDKIVSVNGIPSMFLSLKDIIKIFQRKAGKKIRLRIKRLGERKKFTFRLEDLI